MTGHPESEVPKHEGDLTSLPSNKEDTHAQAVLGGKLVSILLLALLNCIAILIIGGIIFEAQKDSSLRVVGVFGAIALIASIFMLWKLPKWQVSFSKNLPPETVLSLENEMRKTLAQIIGGIFLLAGIYSTLKTIQISEIAQLTGRLDKAVEQLSSEKRQVRIIGVSTIIRLSKESQQYEREARVVFSTHIKEVATRGGQEQENNLPGNALSTIVSNSAPNVSNKAADKHREEVQIIIDYLGNPIGSDDGINLSGTNLEGLRFSKCTCRNWNFSGALLNGAHFDASNLYSVSFKSASLTGVTFKQAVLRNADFTGVDLTNVDFTEADVLWADFSSAQNLSLSQIEKATNFDCAKLPEAISVELKARPPDKKLNCADRP